MAHGARRETSVAHVRKRIVNFLQTTGLASEQAFELVEARNRLDRGELIDVESLQAFDCRVWVPR